jgi:hypothetical protein
MYCKSLIVLFPLAIVVSILLCFTASDYHFGIFKFFFFLDIVDNKQFVSLQMIAPDETKHKIVLFNN